jgi:hypothetical protein
MITTTTTRNMISNDLYIYVIIILLILVLVVKWIEREGGGMGG